MPSMYILISLKYIFVCIQSFVNHNLWLLFVTQNPQIYYIFACPEFVTYVVDVADVADVADVTDVADADNAFHLGISIMETSQCLKQMWCPILT